MENKFSSLVPYSDFLNFSKLEKRWGSIMLGHGGVIEKLLSSLHEQGLKAVVATNLEVKQQYNLDHLRDDFRVSLRHPFLNTKTQRHIGPENTFCLFLRKQNELVGSCCARMLKVKGTLAEDLENLTLQYEDPATMNENDETWLVTASPARNLIRDCNIAFLCGGHVEKQYSYSAGGGFGYDILQRLTRILVLAHWDISYFTSFNEFDATAKIGLRRYGHQGAHPYVRIYQGTKLTSDWNLMVSSADYMTNLYFRPEVGIASRPILEVTADELLQIITDRKNRA